MDVHASHGGCVLAVMRVARDHPSRYRVVRLAEGENTGVPGLHRVTDLVEKPSLDEVPSDLAITGRYVLSPSFFAALHHTTTGAGGAIQLADAVRHRASQRHRAEPIWAYEFTGKRYDTGHPVGLLTTSVAFALARSDLAPALRAYLRTLDFTGAERGREERAAAACDTA